jgi:hypothetical protein
MAERERCKLVRSDLEYAKNDSKNKVADNSRNGSFAKILQ